MVYFFTFYTNGGVFLLGKKKKYDTDGKPRLRTLMLGPTNSKIYKEWSHS